MRERSTCRGDPSLGQGLKRNQALFPTDQADGVGVFGLAAQQFDTDAIHCHLHPLSLTQSPFEIQSISKVLRTTETEESIDNGCCSVKKCEYFDNQFLSKVAGFLVGIQVS